ncbi:MAG: 3-isopropylmalate dehydratase small subunit [Phenylobacterium sp.]|nr:3-isopropylmalate dehydratase small subunit [Phenylobacterium sp.]
MEPFTQVTGPAIPLMRSNVDTDVIIRIERMTALPREQHGRYALEALRYLPDGQEDPASVINQPRFRHAPILLAGPNFGCGSSREPAVTALQGMGLRCLIAPSFGDIFFSNCFQNGLLPIRLPEAVVEHLAALASASERPFTVDLRRQLICLPDGAEIGFSIDPQRRESLLAGLDDIGLTLREAEAIAAWQAHDRVERPWVWGAQALAHDRGFHPVATPQTSPEEPPHGL